MLRFHDQKKCQDSVPKKKKGFEIWVCVRSAGNASAFHDGMKHQELGQVRAKDLC